MDEGLRVGLALFLPALLTFATVPVAITLARRSGFLDSPRGYKAHLRPTPYLGGAAVLLAALPAAVLLDASLVSRYWPLLAAVLFMAALGACDDRLNLSPWLRLVLEALTAWFLWGRGLGWSLFSDGFLNALLTALWVMAIVNAFNLMDNLDGACATVAAISLASISALAAIGGDMPLEILALAFCGALMGFLRFNLGRPSRIFLGDGGSMPIGLLVAGCMMLAPSGEVSGWGTFLIAVLVAGLPVFDTTLVVISRRRRGAQVLSGATDHTTHRLLVFLKTPLAVAGALATAQACLGALAVEASRLGDAALVAISLCVFVLAAATIVLIEGPGWTPVSGDS